MGVIPTPEEFLGALEDKLPRREHRALAAWFPMFFPWQQDLLLDFGRATALNKSRQIGGSYTTAAADALWTLMGERTFLVSINERDADEKLRQVEKHLMVLVALGSHWARPLKKKYINDGCLRAVSGGEAFAFPSTNPARGWRGNVDVDEFAYMENQRRVWESVMGAILHGGRARFTSTPNGPGDLFYQLMKGDAA